eukprot:jgi/Mesvir1/998/Mv17536-RA.1
MTLLTLYKYPRVTLLLVLLGGGSPFKGIFTANMLSSPADLGMFLLVIFLLTVCPWPFVLGGCTWFCINAAVELYLLAHGPCRFREHLQRQLTSATVHVDSYIEVPSEVMSDPDVANRFFETLRREFASLADAIAEGREGRVLESAFLEGDLSGLNGAQLGTLRQQCRHRLSLVKQALARLPRERCAGAAPPSHEDLCVVCLDHKPTVSLVPCHHVPFCSPCFNRWLHAAGDESLKRCPVCRIECLDYLHYARCCRPGGWLGVRQAACVVEETTREQLGELYRRVLTDASLLDKVENKEAVWREALHWGAAHAASVAGPSGHGQGSDDAASGDGSQGEVVGEGGEEGRPWDRWSCSESGLSDD